MVEHLAEHLKEDALDAGLVGVVIPSVFLARKIAVLNKKAHGSFLAFDRAIASRTLSTYGRSLIIGGVVAAGAFLVGKEISRLISPEPEPKATSFVEREQARRSLGASVSKISSSTRF